MSTRQEQREQRREAILYAALDLFAAKGYAATKITDIADSLHISVGLLFHYFESKETLYEELIGMGLEGAAYPAEQTYTHAIDFFNNFAGQLFSYMQEQPYVAKFFVLMADAQRNAGTPEHIRKIALRVDTIQQFVPLVEWGQKEGSIRAGEPLALSNAFWSSIQGIAENYAAHPETGLPRAEWIVDIVRAKKTADESTESGEKR